MYQFEFKIVKTASRYTVLSYMHYDVISSFRPRLIHYTGEHVLTPSLCFRNAASLSWLFRWAALVILISSLACISIGVSARSFDNSHEQTIHSKHYPNKKPRKSSLYSELLDTCFSRLDARRFICAYGRLTIVRRSNDSCLQAAEVETGQVSIEYADHWIL